MTAPEAERKAKFKEAITIRRAIERGKPGLASPSTYRIVVTSALARKTWDVFRQEAEAAMREMARMLPAHGFAEGVRGFGDLGLGIVVAETGDFNDFDGPAKVWKRLGLAVINGECQQRKTDVELADLHGYNPHRRAEIWSLFSDSMFRHQWCSEARAYREALAADPRTAVHPTIGLKIADLRALANPHGIIAQAHPTGPYGEVYARRRTKTLARGFNTGHAHSDATRVMTKAVIVDLWRVWRRQEPRYANIQQEAA